jgi:ABC-type glycerol-3-phosphate transport system substrate-binding protein
MEENVMSKYILWFVIWVMLLSALPGKCQSQAKGTTEPIELIIWAEPWTQETMIMDPTGKGRYGRYLKEQFEREHPEVTVTMEIQGWDESLRQNILNSLAVGAAPDIIVGENYFQQFIDMGALVPLDDAIVDIKDDLIPGTIKAAEQKGSIYGLSSFTGVFGFEHKACHCEERSDEAISL